MPRLPFAFTVVLALFWVSGCKSGYSSKFEAEAACEQWVSLGGTYSVDDGPSPTLGRGIFTYDIRSCKNEEETRQIIGFEIPIERDSFVPDNRDAKSKLKGLRRKKTIEEYFRY